MADLKSKWMFEDCQAAFNVGLLTYEEACRISCARWADQGNQEMAKLAAEAADVAAETE